MIVKAIFAIFCAAGFSLLFIVAGLKRMFSRPVDGRRGESIFWGAIGVILGLAIIGGVAWFVFGPTTEPPETATRENPLTDQQKLDIAAQVVRGERPKSDLTKYGITVGEPQQISVEEFQRRVAAEQATTKPSGK